MTNWWCEQTVNMQSMFTMLSLINHDTGSVGAARRARQLLKVGIQIVRCWVSRFPRLSNFFIDFVEGQRVYMSGEINLSNIQIAEKVSKYLFVGGKRI